jgi:hypothetical protein
LLPSPLVSTRHLTCPMVHRRHLTCACAAPGVPGRRHLSALREAEQPPRWSQWNCQRRVLADVEVNSFTELYGLSPGSWRVPHRAALEYTHE